MQKTESLGAPRGPQTFFERNSPTNFGNLVGREVRDGSNLEEQNGFVKNLFIQIVSLENNLSAAIASQKRENSEIKSALIKSSLALHVKTAAMEDLLKKITDTLEGLNQLIRNLKTNADHISQDSINAINVVKTQLSILENNVLKKVTEMEGEIEYNANETSNAFDKICLIKRYIESKTGDDLSESIDSKPNKINKFVKAAL